MPTNVQNGAFLGTKLIQETNVGGKGRSVFVPMKGTKTDYEFPTYGGDIANPFKGKAKLFAGDLAEFRTNASGMNGRYYILKTFEVAAAVSNTNTVYILRDGFRHIPFVGDVLMVAPDVIGGTGTAVTVVTVTATTTTVGETANVPVWQLAISANLTIAKGAILVEAEEAGSNKAMVVKAINSVAPCDYDMLSDPSLTFGNTAPADTNFTDARYFVAFALGGLMYTKKMSPLPKCVLDLNRSNVNGWFKVNYYDMRAIQDTNTVKEEIDAATVGITPKSGASNPATSTVGAVGQLYINTTDQGTFICTKITGTTTKTYTWKEITLTA